MNALRGEPEISPTLQRQVTTDRVSLPPFDGHRWCGGQAAWDAAIGPAAASPGHLHERESSSLPARWRGNQDGLGYNGQDSLYLVVLPFSDRYEFAPAGQPTSCQGRIMSLSSCSRMWQWWT
jgi:hypothetical protein